MYHAKLPSDTSVVDWDLEISDGTPNSWYREPADLLIETKPPDPVASSLAKRRKDESGTTVPGLTLMGFSDITTDSSDEDQLLALDWDDEDVQQTNDQKDFVPDAQGRVVEGLEQFVLTFLEQLSGDEIELALTNRIRTKEHWSRHRLLHWPKRNKKGSFKSFARLLCVVDLIHEALIFNTPTTKRDIFYKDIRLFKSQSVVNNLVDDIAATLDVSRGDLNVRASPKGLFCGSGVRIHLKQGEIVHGNDTEGMLIPAGADISYIQLSEVMTWVLIVEKEAVFQTLCRARLITNPCLPGHGVVITGKGYPDLATREFVNHLSRTLPTSVPFLALVDADAYGLDIFSVYKFGSQNLDHEGAKTVAPRLIWLGLWASELSSLGLDKEHLIPLTKHDHKKAIDMLRRNKAKIPTQWRKEISHMLHSRRKAEIEILSSASRFVSQIHTSPSSEPQPHLKGEDVTAIDPPIIQYLVPKLLFWMGTSTYT